MSRKDMLVDELRVAQGRLDYHDRSVSHTFSNSGENVSIEIQKYMLEEGRKLKKAVDDLKKELEKVVKK